jgi:hypothetical protein
MTEQVRESNRKKSDMHRGHILTLSADVFGMVATNTDDLSIGQILERALPYFDAVAPMVYPSHYPKNFNGWSNPNDHVYGVVNFSMKRAAERALSPTTTVDGLTHVRVPPKPLRDCSALADAEKKACESENIATTIANAKVVYEKKVYPLTKLRTWIQDFDYGGDYGPTEVRDQIQASYDAGVMSYMIWSPSNRYTTEALRSEENAIQ